MSVKLAVLDANASLADLQTTIAQTEDLGYELITFAKGLIQGQPANLATFRRLTPGTSPGPLTLAPEPSSNDGTHQQDDLNKGEAGGKRVVSYAVAFVKGIETDVAAYRG